MSKQARLMLAPLERITGPLALAVPGIDQNDASERDDYEDQHDFSRPAHCDCQASLGSLDTNLSGGSSSQGSNMSIWPSEHAAQTKERQQSTSTILDDGWPGPSEPTHICPWGNNHLLVALWSWQTLLRLKHCPFSSNFTGIQRAS